MENRWLITKSYDSMLLDRHVQKGEIVTLPSKLLLNCIYGVRCTYKELYKIW